MEPKNKFKLPVQSGEFISVENGECHILCYVEEWEDAPKDTSGYRGVCVHGLSIGKAELRARVINDRGFGQIESEYEQGFAAEPMTQNIFDLWIESEDGSLAFVPVTATEFLEKLMIVDNGCFFVKFARGSMYTQEICDIQEAWTQHKLDSKVARPAPGDARDWIKFYLSKKPELDAPWIADDIFTQISCIEEPSEPDNSTHPFVGRRVLIRRMKGEPQYSGRQGVVESVDDMGQLHGTWGGCALTLKDDFEWIPDPKSDPNHYNDGIIDFRVIPAEPKGFPDPVIVLTKFDGKVISVDPTSWTFSEDDLLDKYRELAKEEFEGDDLEGAVKAFKDYLLACGAEFQEEPENE